jgi:hypothetical protein
MAPGFNTQIPSPSCSSPSSEEYEQPLSKALCDKCLGASGKCSKAVSRREGSIFTGLNCDYVPSLLDERRVNNVSHAFFRSSTPRTPYTMDNFEDQCAILNDPNVVVPGSADGFNTAQSNGIGHSTHSAVDNDNYQSNGEIKYSPDQPGHQFERASTRDKSYIISQPILREDSSTKESNYDDSLHFKQLVSPTLTFNTATQTNSTDCGDCLSSCFKAFESLHMHSSRVTSPSFDTIFAINGEAIECCESLLDCEPCIYKAGLITSVTLLATVIGRMVALYSATYTHLNASIKNSGRITSRINCCGGEDEQRSMMQMILTEFGRIQCTFEQFRAVCLSIEDDDEMRICSVVMSNLAEDLQLTLGIILNPQLTQLVETYLD